MILSPISFQPDRSRINRAQINDTCVACVFQGEREERPPLLPLPGASASGSGHNVPQRAHNTAELATGSVSVLLFRMLLPVAHGHGAECCLPAAAARARRRNCRHRGRLVADQWRDSTIPAGKPNGLPSGPLELEPVPIERKKKGKRFSFKCGTSSFCTCTVSARPMVSQLHYRSIHLDCTPSSPRVHPSVFIMLSHGARRESGCLIPLSRSVVLKRLLWGWCVGPRKGYYESYGWAGRKG